jgi:hypothetical protein
MARCCLLLSLFIGTIASAQQHTVITYTAPVSLVIESDLYIDTLGPAYSLNVISPEIHIYLHPRGVYVDNDQSFSAGFPLRPGAIRAIEYRASVNTDQTKWRELQPVPETGVNNPYGGLLIAALLKVNDSLVLEFRDAGTRLGLQRSVFHRVSLTPVLSQYRVRDITDSIDNNIKSREANSKQNKYKGFAKLQAKGIIVDAGKHIDLLFSETPINKDSSLEYMLSDINADSTSKWQTTGHLLTLDKLTANNTYSLAVRYKGQYKAVTYTIDTLPFWYQHIWVYVVFTFLTLILITVLPYRIYRLRLQAEKQRRINAEQQLRTVQSQLNPHFVFNALSSIDTLVTDGENQKANDYLGDFSDIMRDTLMNTERLFISLAEDIEMLEKYLKLEKLRLGFTYLVDIDPAIKPHMVDFPPMLLQPTVENAVKHGVALLGSEGIITVSYKKFENDLAITITDNGTITPASTHKGTGKGITFTLERIANMKNLYKEHAIDYFITYENPGTTARFRFQNWLNT